MVIMCALYATHTTPNADQHRRLRQWFWRASWSERYKAGGESFVSNDIGRVIKFVVQNEGDVKTFGEVPSEAEWRRTYFRINAARSRALALALAKVGPRCILTGAKIDVQEALSSFNKKQFHHVYPRAHLKRANAEDDNLVLNICLLPAMANQKISDQDPTQYLPKLQRDLAEQADAIFASNMLPKPSLFAYQKATYDEFLAERLKLMHGLVSHLCDGG